MNIVNLAHARLAATDLTNAHWPGPNMRPVPDSWTIVLVGRWNVSILNPGWLGKHIFDTPEVQIEFSLTPGAPPRFTSGDVRVVPQNAAVTLLAVKHTDSALRQAEKAASRLLDLLQHTPVSAVGVNFGFEEQAPDDETLAKLPKACRESLSDQGFEIQQHSYVWQLRKSAQVLNLSATVTPNSLTVDLNFHTDVADAAAAKVALVDKACVHLASARSLLQTTFDLTEDSP